MKTPAAVSVIIATAFLSACGLGRGSGGGIEGVASAGPGGAPGILLEARSLPEGHPPLPDGYAVPDYAGPVLPKGHPPVLPEGHPALPLAHPRCPARGQAVGPLPDPGRTRPLADPPVVISI